MLLPCLHADKRQGHANQLDSIIHPVNAAKKRKIVQRGWGGSGEKAGRDPGD